MSRPYPPIIIQQIFLSTQMSVPVSSSMLREAKEKYPDFFTDNGEFDPEFEKRDGTLIKFYYYRIFSDGDPLFSELEKEDIRAIENTYSFALWRLGQAYRAIWNHFKGLINNNRYKKKI